MAKTYSLQGPIVLETLSNTDALAFCAAVIDSIPSYSMGSATLNIKAEGPADDGGSTQVTGTSLDELKASLEAVKSAPAPTDPSDITYNVRGRVDLVGLSLEDGIGVIDAAMHAIPGDALVVTGMWAQEETAS
jgi:hypothetical protein